METYQEYLCIQNPGEIDIAALHLMGASVKDEGSIGMFGSGTKYGLACLLRNGLLPFIYSGEREIKLGLTRQSFRNEVFDVITIDNQPTSITTRTGPKWIVPHAVREFYSNALDESHDMPEGEVNFYTCSVHSIQGKVGWTRVFIPLSDSIKSMLAKWDSLFLSPKATPIGEHYSGKAYLKSDTGKTGTVFRRGVWCVGDATKEFFFSYDIPTIDLPETRVRGSGDFTYYLGDIFGAIDDVDLIESFLVAMNTKFDGTTIKAERFAEYAALCQRFEIKNPQAWKEAFGRRWKYYCQVPSDLNYVKDEVKALTFVFPYISLMKALDIPHVHDTLEHDIFYRQESWPVGYEERVESAKFLLERNAIKLPWPIIFGRFENTEQIAQADHKAKRVVLGPTAFEDPRDIVLLKALIEEWTHLEHKVADHTVAQQHVYLETIIRLLRR